MTNLEEYGRSIVYKHKPDMRYAKACARAFHKSVDKELVKLFKTIAKDKKK